MLNLNIALYQNDFLYCFAEIYLIFFIIGLLYFSLMFNRQNEKIISTINFLNFNLKASIFFFIIYFFFLFENINFFSENLNLNIYLFNELLFFSKFNLYLKFFIFFLLIFYICFLLFYIQSEKNLSFEFLIIIFLAFLGMNFLLMSNDFISLYLAIELQSLAIYILASFFRNSMFSTEAGLKYFIIGALGSILLLFSFSFIYGMTGITKFTDLFLFNNFLQVYASKNTYIILGLWFSLIFFLVAIFLKLGVVPFHVWVPDVYEGVPLIVLSFLAIFPKIVLFSIFIKFLFLFYDILLLPFHFFCICCAFFSILFGAIGGLFQIKLKRLFAYSTIANVGFILLGFSLFNLIGCFSAFFYLFFYIIFLITFFSILLCLKRSNNSIELKKISDLKNLFIINPTLSLIFALTLFSFAGIPPLAGFFIKMFLFFSLLTNQLFFISIFLILVSGISCFYYIRLIKIMFFSNSINVTSWIFLIKINSLISYIIAVSFLVNIFFIFYPEFFLLIINDVIFSFYL